MKGENRGEGVRESERRVNREEKERRIKLFEMKEGRNGRRLRKY